MSSSDPRAEYQTRLADRRARSAALDRINALIANFRLVLALAGAVTLWMASVRTSIAFIWPLLSLFGFGGSDE